MSESTIRRRTGWLGIALMALTLIEVPLYFIYPGPPPDGNILARVLMGLFVVTGIVIFFAYYRGIVVRAKPALEPTATLLFSAVLLYAAVSLIASALEAGLAIASPENVDPTIAANGTYIMYGSIGRIMTALFLALAGYTAMAANVLPKWIGWLGYGLSLFSLAFVPSLFFGNDPTQFYSANGWGTTAIGASSLMYWVVAASIVMVVRARR